MTSEFPRTKGGMLILLIESRHALYDITTAPSAHVEPQDRSSGMRLRRMAVVFGP